jgi:hypothetical protein
MYVKICLPVLLAMLLTVCTGLRLIEAPPPTPIPENPNVTPPLTPREELLQNPYAPGKGDETMQRGEVYIDSQEIIMLKSLPPQFQLHVMGSLPTPCHQLRVVIDEPDDQNQIQVQIYSLVDPNTVCIQVLETFDATIPLGSYASGSYTLFVNGEKVGDITS